MGHLSIPDLGQDCEFEVVIKNEIDSSIQAARDLTRRWHMTRRIRGIRSRGRRDQMFIAYGDNNGATRRPCCRNIPRSK